MRSSSGILRTDRRELLIMKVLGINGSPRIGGNTDTLLDKVLQGARSKGADTEKIVLNELKFVPCQECEKMADDGGCLVKDGMQPVYKKIKEADAIVFASPVFFGSLSAQSKMMIDRFQCAWRAKYILKKDAGYKKIPGAFISVEGSNRKDFFENAKSIVKNFFATVNVQYKKELFCSGIDEKGSILKHAGCLKKAFDIGVKIV
ncbi:MAG TPA: flavodoxin family protein [Candidatus Omnitrophica bacterium]|nr:flavodoxin family protein [Candidatus Omnitrophota bacterium]